MLITKHTVRIITYLYGLGLVLLQCVEAADMSVPISPCPKLFTYRRDLRTNRVFGKIDIRGLQMGQKARLNVDLALGTQLRSVSCSDTPSQHNILITLPLSLLSGLHHQSHVNISREIPRGHLP